MQLYTSGIIDAQEVLEQTEVADTEGVMQRTSIINQQQQMIAQLEEQLKATKGDLQTAQRESTHDRKRVEIEKFKTKLNSASNKSQSAVNLFEARLNDELQKTRQDLRQDEQRKEPIAVS
jgi:Skp family chaperone for outer membrane proteins